MGTNFCKNKLLVVGSAYQEKLRLYQNRKNCLSSNHTNGEDESRGVFRILADI